MAWDYFPIEAGAPISTQVLGELRHAIIERAHVCYTSTQWDDFVAIFLTPRTITMSGASWTASTKTLTQADAFENYWHPSEGVKTVTITGGTGATKGDYAISSKSGSNSITLSASIAAGDISDGSVTAVIHQHDVLNADVGQSVTRVLLSRYRSMVSGLLGCPWQSISRTSATDFTITPVTMATALGGGVTSWPAKNVLGSPLVYQILNDLHLVLDSMQTLTKTRSDVYVANGSGRYQKQSSVQSIMECSTAIAECEAATPVEGGRESGASDASIGMYWRRTDLFIPNAIKNYLARFCKISVSSPRDDVGEILLTSITTVPTKRLWMTSSSSAMRTVFYRTNEITGTYPTVLDHACVWRVGTSAPETKPADFGYSYIAAYGDAMWSRTIPSGTYGACGTELHVNDLPPVTSDGVYIGMLFNPVQSIQDVNLCANIPPDEEDPYRGYSPRSELVVTLNSPATYVAWDFVKATS